MCTVTVIPAAAAARFGDAGAPLARVVCNRDEHRSRPAPTPPVIQRTAGRAAIMPIDPPSGGTWIGASDSGIVACLLNANPPRSASAAAPWSGRCSRGAIVPAVLRSSHMDEAAQFARSIDPARFPPFRLLVLDADSYLIAFSDGYSLAVADPEALRNPLMLTSSGLGDHLVEHIRRDLFERTLAADPDSLAAQARFHDHRWSDRPHLSVVMSRADARTVSRTTADLHADAVDLRHTRVDDALAPQRSPSRARLPLLRSEVAA